MTEFGEDGIAVPRQRVGRGALAGLVREVPHEAFDELSRELAELMDRGDGDGETAW